MLTVHVLVCSSGTARAVWNLRNPLDRGSDAVLADHLPGFTHKITGIAVALSHIVMQPRVTSPRMPSDMVKCSSRSGRSGYFLSIDFACFKHKNHRNQCNGRRCARQMSTKDSGSHRNCTVLLQVSDSLFVARSKYKTGLGRLKEVLIHLLN